MRIRTACLIMILGLSSSLVTANPSYSGYYPPPQYQLPGNVLRGGLEKVIGFLAQGPAQDRQQLINFVEQEMAGYFDFDYMNYWVMGRMQRQLSPQQAHAMQERLKRMFLNAMAGQLASYRHGRIQFLRPRGNPASGEVNLGIRVYSPQGYATRLDFRLHNGQQGWKVFDVVADGQSVVAHYRALFARQGFAGNRATANPYYR